MAVTRKYDDVMVVQLESDPVGLVIRKIAEDSQVSAAEVCRQIIAKGLPQMADYADALTAVKRGWTPPPPAPSRSREGRVERIKRRVQEEMSSNSPAA